MRPRLRRRRRQRRGRDVGVATSKGPLCTYPCPSPGLPLGQPASLTGRILLRGSPPASNLPRNHGDTFVCRRSILPRRRALFPRPIGQPRLRRLRYSTLLAGKVVLRARTGIGQSFSSRALQLVPRVLLQFLVICTHRKTW